MFWLWCMDFAIDGSLERMAAQDIADAAGWLGDPRDKEYFHTYEKQGFTYLCIGVAKQRQGSTGKACVLFEKKTMRYFAIDREKTP